MLRSRPCSLVLLAGALMACPQGSYLPDADTAPVDASTEATSQPTTSPDPTTEPDEPPPCNMNGICEKRESPQSCREDCKDCGNGMLDDGEVCDDGATNSPGNAYHAGYGDDAPCNSSCTGKVPFCGDRVCQSGPENTLNCPGDGCVARCGNGAIEANEACDDGNLANTDACLDTCQPATCGDGFVQDGVETCDDANLVDTDACVMCEDATCGDGFIWADMEDCDDANAVETDACDMACKTVVHRKVFVSSVPSKGDLLGLSGADSRCTTLANAAELPGEFRAWLSDATEGPATRFDTSFTGVYELVDGTLVAHGWDDLTDGSLSHPINRTQTGSMNDTSVWTNTTPKGQPLGAFHCSDWKSKSGAQNGWYGKSNATDSTWTQVGAQSGLPCDIGVSTYCFEDPSL